MRNETKFDLRAEKLVTLQAYNQPQFVQNHACFMCVGPYITDNITRRRINIGVNRKMGR